MLAGAAALAVLTGVGDITRGLLLALTAVVGIGTALALPTFAAIQPELVPRERIPQAALLNGANLNVARAVGPALGGLLIGAVGPEATFALNAASFVAVLIALGAWDRPPDERPLGAESIGSAIAAGARYVRSAPQFGTVLVRTWQFVVFASALWALLPIVVRGPLGLGANGYGLLLASIGAGAVTGAFVVPVLQQRMRSNEVVAIGSAAYAGSLLAVGVSRSIPLIVVALVVAGLAWITVMSSLSAFAQVLLPNWTRARGLAFFTFVFMGGQALGSVVWGAIASAASIEAAFTIAAAGQLLGPIVAMRAFVLDGVGDVRHVRHWPEPHVVIEIDPREGPVVVTVEWRVRPDAVEEFLDVMRQLGPARRRTGASSWGLFHDAAEPLVYVEISRLPTWGEHMRQHLERGTAADEQLEADARAFSAEPPRVRHLVRTLPRRWPEA
jgi:predicted MFS family arabinose efflux permease